MSRRRMSRHRRKPSAPRAMIARPAQPEGPTEPAEWGVNSEALALAAHADVETVRGAGRRIVRARRIDVFERLLGRGSLTVRGVLALRRLQDDMTLWHRDGLGVMNLADAKAGVAPRPGAMAEVRLAAAARVRAALDLAGPASARLLAALCEAGAATGADLDWRETVRLQTGERLADAQTAVLRAAVENLAGAYARLDGRRRAACPSPLEHPSA